MAIPAPNLTAGGVNEMWIRQDWLDAVSYTHLGTTKIGKYVLNHSYMLPGLVCTVVSVVSAILIGAVAVSYTHLDVYKRQAQASTDHI